MVDQRVKHHPGTMFSDLPVDMLEEVVVNLPTIDMLSALCVSHEWLHAVRASLHSHPRLFPWLILRCRNHPTSSKYSIHALDPHSRTWLSITCRDPTGKQLLLTPFFLHASTGDRLYTLSLSQLAISRDPFGSAYQMNIKGPKIWRQDPIMAAVGQWLVVVGGGFLTDLDGGEEEGAVEVYNKQTGVWELAEPMPTKFEGSTYAAWLSVAVADKRLYVIEKKTGWISQFDPESKKWGPTRQLMPDLSLSRWAIEIVGKHRLLLVGAGSGGGELKGAMEVRAWEVEGDTLRVIDNKSAEMPAEMVNRLYPNFDRLDDARQTACSVEVHGTERGGYIFDRANMKNGAVMYQLSPEEMKDGRRVVSWEWISCPVGYNPMEGTAAGCSPVPLHEVARCFV